MKTKSILLAIAVLLCSKAFAYDFSAVCESGQTLYYNITSNEEPYMVEVTFEDDGTLFDKSLYEQPSYYDIAGDLIIPSSVIFNGTLYSVTGIDSHAFRECHDITSVTIPNSVTKIGDQAFYGCIGLMAATISNSVTIIESQTFYGCIGLVAANISNSVTIIESQAFYGCRELMEFTIPNSVISIGEGVFVGTGWFNSQPDGILYHDGWCLGYKGAQPTGTLSLDEGTKGISAYAFRNCQEITSSLTLPNSVISICLYAFSGCSGLTEVTIGNSVKNIGLAFNNCSGLTTVNFNATNCTAMGNSVTGTSAFSGCASLSTLNIGENVINIPSYAFNGCNGLTEVTIGDSVRNIGRCAFKGCIKLFSMTVPDSVTEIGDMAFGQIRNIQYNGTATGSPWGALSINGIIDGDLIYSDETKTVLIGSNPLATNVTIPNSVTSISAFAFVGCASLASVTIPNSVVNIGGSVFKDCVSLVSVSFPNSVTSIGHFVFENCSNLNSVVIPNSVSNIGIGVFKNCIALESVIVESGNQIYDSHDDCNAIIETATNILIAGCKNSEIPNSVTSIGSYAFYGCRDLTEITIPHQVRSIGTDAFNHSGLISVIIPNSVTVIEPNAFMDCRELMSVTMGNSLECIGEYAFMRCNGLTSIDIPESVTQIGRETFAGCTGLTTVNFNAISCVYCGNNYSPLFSQALLTTINIGENVRDIPAYIFSGCRNLTSITIPESVKTIGNYAFYDCESLRTLNYNATNCISMGSSYSSAFYRCELRTINIGENVINIPAHAFLDNRWLQTVYSNAVNPPALQSDSFDPNQNYAISIIVPCGSAPAYNNAEQWNYFTNIQEDCSSVEETGIADIQIFPNPVEDILNITSPEEISEIEIVNVMGQIVYRKDVNRNNAVCDVEGLANGMYVVRIRPLSLSKGADVIPKKFIKE
ncbi:MAG: leucine-rich repeat domain-containing protein [Bacteroidales bacterium]|nr:leucine-rich repeat domain-containing protein [Bacteroidales bacterium]